MTSEGMVEVFCQDCGESLGWQSNAVEVDYRWWQHNRCPEKTARAFGITRELYDRLLTLISGSIVGCYPEIPGEAQRQRGTIAAGYAMEVLARFGYVIRPEERSS